MPLRLVYVCPRCKSLIVRRRGDTLKAGPTNYFFPCPICGLETKTTNPTNNDKWPYKSVV